jgi:biopolymer transport protein ExbD
MGAVDTPHPRAGKSKAKGFHRPKRRVGVRIDMTPMVDVAFLLLIFFMVTTVFRTPQALEINLPPDKEAKVNVAQSKVLTVRVLTDRAYWKHGTDPWARTDVANISKVFKIWSGDKDAIVLIEIDREAKFNNMVKIIDDLDLAHMTRFSLNTLKPEEKKEVEAL